MGGVVGGECGGGVSGYPAALVVISCYLFIQGKVVRERGFNISTDTAGIVAPVVPVVPVVPGVRCCRLDGSRGIGIR